MSKVTYVLLHIPTGILITDFLFDKKSQAVAFISKFPLDAKGYFKKLRVEFHADLTPRVAKELLYITQLTVILRKIVPTTPVAFSIHKYVPKAIETFSPVEFIPVPIKASQLEGGIIND